MSFASQLEAFSAKTKLKAVEAVQLTVIELGERLLERSPIGQWDLWSEQSKHSRPRPPYEPGQFIGSWAYSYSEPLPVTPEIDPSGDSSRRRFAEVRSAPAFGQHFLYNNLEYAMKLERGWAIDPSKAHMVDLAKVEFSGIVSAVVKKVNI